MENISKIRQFLEKRNTNPDGEGAEGKVYFLQDENENEVVLKEFFSGMGRAITPERFFKIMKQQKKDIDDLIQKGVQTPRLLDYLYIKGKKGGQFFSLEEKAQGSPIYLYSSPGSNVQRISPSLKDATKNEIEDAVLEYNLIQQQKMWDAPQEMFNKRAEGISVIYDNNKEIDVFPENVLFDEVKGFSEIDLPENHLYDKNRGELKCLLEKIKASLCVFDPSFSINPTITKQSPKLLKMNLLLRLKQLNGMKKEKLLRVNSETERRWIVENCKYAMHNIELEKLYKCLAIRR